MLFYIISVQTEEEGLNKRRFGERQVIENPSAAKYFHGDQDLKLSYNQRLHNY